MVGERKIRVTERLLAEIWKHQLVKKDALRTTKGQRIEVIYPGRENDDSGPDFRHAIIIVEGAKLLQGDVELHVRASDWRAHTHYQNPNYNGVILHVVIWEDSKGGDSLLENGRRVMTLPLHPCLEGSIEELRSVAQLRPLPPQPCNGALEHLGGEIIVKVLDEAGEERFLLKAKHFEKELATKEVNQAFYEGFMGALGYAKNKETFQKLARGLPLAVLKETTQGRSLPEHILTLQAMLLGTAGLLPRQRHQRRGEEDAWARRLEQRWCSLGNSQKMGGNEWRFFRVRPQNFPVRRIAATSYLLSKYREEGFFEDMLKLMRRINPKRACKELEERFIVTTRGYWASHFDFGMEAGWNPTLIGRRRAGEIVINILLPFFFAWAGIASQPWLKDYVLELYHYYPQLEENRITRYMQRQVFSKYRPELINSAQRQQGLIYLYKTFCTELRCSQCPLRCQ